MSLSTIGVWAVGVWSTTAWAPGVWYEVGGEPPAPQPEESVSGGWPLPPRRKRRVLHDAAPAPVVAERRIEAARDGFALRMAAIRAAAVDAELSALAANSEQLTTALALAEAKRAAFVEDDEAAIEMILRLAS